MSWCPCGTRASGLTPNICHTSSRCFRKRLRLLSGLKVDSALDWRSCVDWWSYTAARSTLVAMVRVWAASSSSACRFLMLEYRDHRKDQETGEEKPRSGLKRRILVVDDNADSATTLALLLRRMGHEIQTAHDGLEAVQAAAAFRPQVILLDIGLPKMNGYEAAKRMREQPCQEKVAIIALTGWGQERDKQRAYDAGIRSSPDEAGRVRHA